MENLKEQFGDSIILSDDFKWEWVGIPHIYHTPFYVYAYAFGQLLALSLYQQFKAEGESFKPKYLKILSAGGSEAPEKVLAEAGVDIRSAKFWQGGFDVLEKLVARWRSCRFQTSEILESRRSFYTNLHGISHDICHLNTMRTSM
jgi:oligoendopeptidase F